MLKNYLLAAVRNLQKNSPYSLINVTGIGLGLATCVLLFLWTSHELSFDRFHENASRIYRASLEYSFGGQLAKTSVSPNILLPVLRKNFAEVENGVRLWNPSVRSLYVLKNGDKAFQEKKFYFADSTFFQVFSFELLQGISSKALTLPNSLLVTPAAAKKYFGTEDVIGKTMTVNDKTEYKITGVIKSPPPNSMIQFDFIASFVTLDAARENTWWDASYQTYILLHPNTNMDLLREKTKQIVKKELASELTNPGDYVVYNFTPFTEIYLKSDVDEPEAVGSIQYIYIFSVIGLLVLIAACINYVNLATARAAERAKEVSIRKVSGAADRQLFFQFLGESFVATFIGFCVAFVIAAISLPAFNSLTGKQFAPTDLFNSDFLSVCVTIYLGTAFLAGVYPAVAITSFKPASVLKGNFKSSGKGLWLRQSLVVFQFSISTMLLIGTIVILKQIDFIQNKKLGYDKENIIIVPLDNRSGEVYDQLKTEFLRSGVVTSMGRAKESPAKIIGGYGMKTSGSSNRGIIVRAMGIDKDFVPTMKMNLIEGNNFTEADYLRVKKDTVLSLILNQSAVREMSLKQENAVGTKIEFNGNKAVISAVVEDFHFSSLHEKIGPMVLFSAIENWQVRTLFVRLNPGNIKTSVDKLKTIGRSILSHRPFDYEFLDQQYQKMYNAEQRIGKITILFASLAIVIACLGLFGLIAFTASQKAKEIGIRKILGATSVGIVGLITKNYVGLVVISSLIGLPTAYWALENWWLSGFAYHTTIGITPLLISSTTCISIAMATASYQAVRAAWANPANALRRE